MGQQHSTQTRRRRLSLLVITLLTTRDVHLSYGGNVVVNAQLLVPPHDSQASPYSWSPHKGGLSVQDPQSSYQEDVSTPPFSVDDNSCKDCEENGVDQSRQQRDQLEEQCRQFMEASPNLAPPPPEPRMIGAASAPGSSTWRLWYRTPAKSIEQDGFLIGNGRTQVLVGGAINVERLVLSEESCWSGGPGSARMSTSGSRFNLDVETESDDGYEYRGGNVPETEAQQRQDALLEFRNALKEKQVIKPSMPIVKTLQGDERGFGRPEAFGEVLVEEMHAFGRVDHYSRELDLDSGTVKVSFSVGNIKYTREHFCSYPDSICVMRMQSSVPKSINVKVSIKAHHNQNVEYSNVHNRLGMRSQLASNNMTIEAQVAVKAEGPMGVSMSNNRQVIALGFDTVTLYYAFGTGWSAGAFPDFEDKDPHDRLVGAVDKATTMFYVDQIQKHVQDYQTLFQGFGLDLGQPENVMATNELIEASHMGKAKEEENYLEALMVQYGRYLLIASSRPGSLPVSGHSVWSRDADSPVDSPSDGYKMNIDLQMNYWLAESTGLGETVSPLIDYMESLLVPRGQDTAKIHHGARGWTTHTYSNIWAHTGPTAQPRSFYFPAASAWLCQQAWDRYVYSQDYSYLKDHAYKLMKGASQFWLDSLLQFQGNGTYLASPSYSPEHGPYTEGSALDQQLIWQLFDSTLEAVAIVGERDKVFVQNLTSTLANLSPGLRIGNWGQLQEWNLDLDDPNEAHRHLGPFWAVYPGRQIFLPRNSTDGNRDELLEAARLTLAKRGMGLSEENLGWPKSWRAAVWARLGDGAKAYEALDLFKKNNVKHSNLLDFEQGLSGQLGIGAAILEMVIQSQAPGYLDILTAAETGLPARWLKKGGVQGFKTREGHNVTTAWEDAKVRSVEVLATTKAAVLQVKIGTLKGEDETPSEKVHVSIKGSNKVPVFSRERESITLTMAKGQTYVIQIDP
ncbi:Six-hairpin glycosidase-like protein [Dissophora ornata]|nr:Six-hairpin glycosidase-like protein [Dissophora ornata]